MRIGRVLIAVADFRFSTDLAVRLEDEGMGWTIAPEGARAVRAVQTGLYDIVIADEEVCIDGSRSDSWALPSSTDPVVCVMASAALSECAVHDAIPNMVRVPGTNRAEVVRCIRRMLGLPEEGAKHRVPGPVLLVGNEPPVLDRINDALVSVEDIRPGRAGSPREARELLLTDSFGSVVVAESSDASMSQLLDIWMAPTTPVIGITPDERISAITRLLRRGCDDVLTLEEATRQGALAQSLRRAYARSRRRSIAAVLEEGRAELISSTLLAELIAEARVDRLTGLSNRAALEDAHAELHRRMIDEHAAYAVCMIDIDNFKEYNDKFGHLRGDKVLRQVAEALQSSVREGDFLARYGGEEFTVLIRHPTGSIARELGERFRAAVWSLALPGVDGRRITVSVGVSAREVGSRESAEAVLDRADKALYEAKRLGRNAVVVAGRPVEDEGTMVEGDAA